MANRRSICEWIANVAIAWTPIACHLLIALVSNKDLKSEPWALDFILVALTTGGLSVVTLLKRIARGEVDVNSLPPHCIIISALNLVAFVFAGAVYGVIMAKSETASIAVPVCLLAATTAMSLYYEMLVIVPSPLRAADP